MKLAKTVACGAAALGLAAAGALAGEGSFGMNDSGSSNEPMHVYEVDEERDGVTVPSDSIGSEPSAGG